MKLAKIEIKNYRSLYYDYDNKSSFTLDLSGGVNAITGPNNAGKSNIFRALALALDPDFEYDRRVDMAQIGKWSKPVVTLTFKVTADRPPSRERTLLKRLDRYERAANPEVKRTYADDGEVRLRATIEGGDTGSGVRRCVFVARQAGALSLADDDPLTVRAFEQFQKCLQFVVIRSGESLESLLEGRFSEVLHTSLRDDLAAEFDAANESRNTYVEALQSGVLLKLRDRLGEELGDLFPEVSAVTLEPGVRPLEATLMRMQVQVEDAAVTDLADKGTGVRGGLIVAILQHLAETSPRSIVFAVEEPESFLHPAAQESLREDLEALSTRPDVTLLVTTHSPHIASRQPESKTFAIQKHEDGRTALGAEASGDEPLADALGGLFRNATIVGALDRAAHIPSAAQAILVVEGETDRSWLQLAAKRSGRPELLDGLVVYAAGDGMHQAGAGGAPLVVMQGLILKAVSGLPVGVLLDNDESGQRAAATLRQISERTKTWTERKQVFSYRHAIPHSSKDFPYEAEDLWPDHLHRRFIETLDESQWGKRPRPKPFGGSHYDYHAKVKAELAEHLEASVRKRDCTHWTDLLELIRGGLDLDADRSPEARQ